MDKKKMKLGRIYSGQSKRRKFYDNRYICIETDDLH